MKSLFSAALFLASVSAQSDYDNKCIRCVDEGYQFCSSDGVTGTCLDATCSNADDDEAARLTNPCTLTSTPTCDLTPMIAYTQCQGGDATNECTGIDKCMSNFGGLTETGAITITKDIIEGKGVRTLDPDND